MHLCTRLRGSAAAELAVPGLRSLSVSEESGRQRKPPQKPKRQPARNRWDCLLIGFTNIVPEYDADDAALYVCHNSKG